MATKKKLQLVDKLKNDLSDAQSVVVTYYQGLTVSEMTELRAEARAKGVKIIVVKNSLFKIAANDTDYKNLVSKHANKKGCLSGPVAVAISKDPVNAAKVVVDFAKKQEKLKVLYGAIGANFLLADKDLKALADLPSENELRSKLIGLLNAPASKLARLVKEVPSGVVRVIKQHSESNY